MANGGEVRIRTHYEDDGAVAGLRNVQREAQNVGGAASEGFTVAKAVTADFVSQGINKAIGAVKDLVGNTLSIGSSFETSMSKVKGLISSSSTDLEGDLARLSDTAKELGASTTFSATEAADALGYMALAGWDVDSSIASVGSVLNLAQAGAMDLASASDLVTDYLSAFGLEASDAAHFTDVLARAQATANTDVEGLGMAFKNCSANAHAAGMSVETTTAAISMMANQGLKGSEAGTALNAVMRDMTAKMQDGAIKIGDASVAVVDAQGNYRDFADILADVEAATNGMGDAEKAAALQSTFTADSIKGLNLLLGAGSGQLKNFRSSLVDSSGAAADMAATMTDNLDGSMASFNSKVESLYIDLYEKLEPAIRSVVDFTTQNVLPFVSVLIDNLPTVAVVIGTIAATLIAAAFPQILAGITGAFAALNAAMAANPISIVILAFGALIAIIVTLWNNCDEFREFWTNTWNNIVELFGPVIGVIVGLITSVIEIIGEWVAIFAEAAVSIFDTAIKPIMDFFGMLFTAIADKVNLIVGVIVALVAMFVNAAKDVYNQFVQPIVDFFGGILSSAQEKFNAVRDAIQQPLETAKNFVKGIIDKIKSFFNFSIEWPHVPLPHFGISPSDWHIGDLLKGSIPRLDIEWYAKAMDKGMVLDSPTIFGAANGKMLGAGEAGSETVVGTASLMDMIKQAVGDRPTTVYNIGDVTLSVDDLKDIMTVEMFAEILANAKRAYA